MAQERVRRVRAQPGLFVAGRPYLDGLRYMIVAERGTRFAALQAGRLDAAMPSEGNRTLAAQRRAAVPAHPLRVEITTLAMPAYVDFASFVVDELRKVGVAPLQPVESAQWHPLAYQLGANLTGLGVDDPDATFFENYACGSPRNYTDYCDEQATKLMERQSKERDPRKRHELVRQLQLKLEEDVARPVMGWRLFYFAQWPHVRNLVPHHSALNWSRMQEVWLDR